MSSTAIYLILPETAEAQDDETTVELSEISNY